LYRLLAYDRFSSVTFGTVLSALSSAFLINNVSAITRYNNNRTHDVSLANREGAFDWKGAYNLGDL